MIYSFIGLTNCLHFSDLPYLHRKDDYEKARLRSSFLFWNSSLRCNELIPITCILSFKIKPELFSGAVNFQLNHIFFSQPKNIGF